MRTSICLTIEGVDLYADISFECTYEGWAGSREEPPESPEFQITEFTLHFDDPSKTALGNAPIECPDWLRTAICEGNAAFEAMCDEYRENR